jgi:spore germination cell wall hydrolase CwlJ-like protein
MTTATISPDVTAMPTTAVPYFSSGMWTIIPDITGAVIAPIPATMSADLRKRRRGVADIKARECLATAIYFEARGESKRGQAAVAQVILNRASSRGFPSTICGVVYQNANRRNGCQFSFACDGKSDRILERKAWQTANRIASDVLAGRSRIPELVNATHYHARYVSPYWAPKMKRLARIGRHIFYDA